MFSLNAVCNSTWWDYDKILPFVAWNLRKDILVFSGEPCETFHCVLESKSFLEKLTVIEHTIPFFLPIREAENDFLSSNAMVGWSLLCYSACSISCFIKFVISILMYAAIPEIHWLCWSAFAVICWQKRAGKSVYFLLSDVVWLVLKFLCSSIFLSSQGLSPFNRDQIQISMNHIDDIMRFGNFTS